MVAIEIGKELYLENVLSLRKQMRHNDINDEIMKIIRYLIPLQ